MSLKKMTLTTTAIVVLTMLLAVGTAAATTINQSLSFTVPDVYDPTCITRNGETTCTPDQAASTVTLAVVVTEAETISVADGAPNSQQNGQSCSKLAKTVTVKLNAGGSVTVSRDGTVIGQPITATAPGVSESIELCQN